MLEVLLFKSPTFRPITKTSYVTRFTVIRIRDSWNLLCGIKRGFRRFLKWKKSLNWMKTTPYVEKCIYCFYRWVLETRIISFFAFPRNFLLLSLHFLIFFFQIVMPSWFSFIIVCIHHPYTSYFASLIKKEIWHTFWHTNGTFVGYIYEIKAGNRRSEGKRTNFGEKMCHLVDLIKWLA